MALASLAFQAGPNEYWKVVCNGPQGPAPVQPLVAGCSGAAVVERSGGAARREHAVRSMDAPTNESQDFTDFYHATPFEWLPMAVFRMARLPLFLSLRVVRPDRCRGTWKSLGRGN
jgi:hypothetical protein